MHNSRLSFVQDRCSGCSTPCKQHFVALKDGATRLQRIQDGDESPSDITDTEGKHKNEVALLMPSKVVVRIRDHRCQMLSIPGSRSSSWPCLNSPYLHLHPSLLLRSSSNTCRLRTDKPAKPRSEAYLPMSHMTRTTTL